MPAYDGVFELRFSYSVPVAGQVTLPHQHTIDVNVQGFPDVGTAFADIILIQKNSGEIQLNTWVELYMTRLQPFFSTGTEFSVVELWQYPLTGTNATWVSVYDLGIAGTSGSPANPAQQSTLTIRSAAGGILRHQLMEVVFLGQGQENPPFAQSEVTNLVTFLTDVQSPVRARDDGYLVAPLRWSLGQNEKVWRKRYRP